VCVGTLRLQDTVADERRIGGEIEVARAVPDEAGAGYLQRVGVRRAEPEQNRQHSAGGRAS
jgi:hypothetical protein